MSKYLWLALLLILPAQAQVITGRPGNPNAKTFILSSQILHEGSFQLQRSGPGLTSWLVLTNFNALPGTNGFSHTITNQQHYYRLMRLTTAPTLTNQPTGLTNFHNQEVRLEAGATGSWPLRYFWFRNAEPIPGATSNVLVYAGHTNLSGNYTVLVSNNWGLALSPAVAVKTINPRLTSIMGKKIQHVIKGQQGGFLGSGSFETTYSNLGYNTTSPNAFLNDAGQWQHGGLPTSENPTGALDNVSRIVWSNGFVYPNGTRVDLTYTNFNEGTFELRVPNVSGRQFGDFKVTN
jgi:hypothetical protein